MESSDVMESVETRMELERRSPSDEEEGGADDDNVEDDTDDAMALASTPFTPSLARAPPQSTSLAPTIGATMLGGTVLGGTVLGGAGAGAAVKKTKNKRRKPAAKGGPASPSASVSASPTHIGTATTTSGSASGVHKTKSYVLKTHRDNEYSSEEEEDEEDYKRGGYHPVALGDVFARRYAVEAKLGWGHFSTVWLARDLRAASPDTSSQVALKIVKSAQHYSEAARDEVKILERLAMPDPQQHAGYACVIRLLDHFEVRGPHGVHVAMVFEKLGCNLLTLIRMYRYKGLPVPLVRHFAKQIVLGVAYLHKCRIVHTDLKPENLLLLHTPKLLKDLPKEDRHAHSRHSRSDSGDHGVHKKSDKHGDDDDDGLGEDEERSGAKEASSSSSSRSEGKLHLPWAPDELRSVFGNGSDAFRLKIVDLGNACWFDRHFTEDVQTRQYRAPEVILGARFDERIDVWSIACIIFELLTGDLLFEPKSGRSYDKNDDHLAQMQELLGRMPRHFALTGRYARNYFNRRGELRYIKTLKFWSLRDVLRDKYHFSEADADAVSKFLLPMLHFEPARRSSAEEMLDAPWIRDVNINSLESVL